ncbi:MAG: hypothetical protein PVH63_12680 [Balneolaceae bacterium]|jgi:hypothetical protein
MGTKRNSISPRREKIIQVLEEAGEAMQIREIVDKTDLEYNNARSALSEMTKMNLLVRVHRGVYDLPKRVEQDGMESPDHPLQKILLNQQILKVLLNIVITNKSLMEALLLGQQEIISTIREINPDDEKREEAINDLEEIFAKRVEWHFDIAAEQVVEQYTKLPEEVFDVLVSPLTRDKGEEGGNLISRLQKKYKEHAENQSRSSKTEAG